MPQPYVASDIGGFGRLAQVELQKRREGRLDKESALRQRLSQIQLQQAESNIAKIGRDRQIKGDLSTLFSGLPQGENRFTAGYKYLMENKEYTYADDFMKEQSNRIDRLWGKDKYAAAKMYNETIGRVMGSEVNPVPGKDEIVEATLDGKKIYMRRTAKGFVLYDIPEGVEIDSAGGFGDPTEEKIEFWARQSIATGKKVFNVRGKEANRLNNLIERKKADILLEEGVTGEEATYLQKDREAIQKSIAAQEKQRGSMVSFVENLGKQIDHVADVAQEIKTYDVRLFNKPARWLKRKLSGSPELSKYEVYLGEIQSEIGKLSSGSTASVSELSEGAREKWEGILDENLSIKDMLEVLKEVKEAGFIRMRSVDEGLAESRERLRAIGEKKPKSPLAKPTEKKEEPKVKQKYKEGQTAGGGKLIFKGGVWRDNK